MKRFVFIKKPLWNHSRGGFLMKMLVSSVAYSFGALGCSQPSVRVAHNPTQFTPIKIFAIPSQ
ncbi:hypothetical protein DVG78_16230 [Runella aurantiaca]|uniref:Uncharacterized protein n=1 Tax=Runella aurantiaca TaxID=2282308 RepID=A0A369IBA2_9BACT|nr:hypothetical protein DVG78_16230 [Runella aurantiaca]